VEVRTGFWWVNVRERELLGRPRRRRENNIKLDLKKIGWGMDWIDLAQDRDRWWALVNAVLNIRFPKKRGDLLD
jgi:hypothetical protein